MVNIDPILLIPIVGDILAGIWIVRSALHSKLGVFDIAYVVDPLGRAKENDEQIYQVRARVEFNPANKKFRLGRGVSSETYRVEAPSENEVNRIRKLNEKKKTNLLPVPEAPADELPGPAFLQWTHRVWFFQKGKAYPISIGIGHPARNTTAKGMDMLITQSLWGQAVASLKKTSIGIPVLMAVMCMLAGAGIAGILLLLFHPGFIPIGTQIGHNATATFSASTSNSVAGFHQ